MSRTKLAALRLDLPEAEVIRQAVNIGLIDLLNGEEEDAVLRRRLADKSPDVDGETFLLSLKGEVARIFAIGLHDVSYRKAKCRT